MKRICRLLLCLLLLAGCARVPAPQHEEKPAEAPESLSAPEETSAPDEPADGAPASDGEPEGWEEEWPEEFAVASYRLEEGAIAQTGELNRYRHTQLDGAERYMDIIADYVRQFLGGDLAVEEDSPHDGYANWFYRGENGAASVSGSSITGRFCYSLQPDFDRILNASGSGITDKASMEQAARDFTGLFMDITGELELLSAVEQEAGYSDPRSDEPRDVSVPVMVYTFRSAENSVMSLEIQDGRSVPVRCGDSTVDDLTSHCFTVTVWPDGTVVEADNYITRCDVTDNGTVRMVTEDDLPMLLGFLTSTTQHDTAVFESIRADGFDVYFGSADIEPAVTVDYHFESAPDEHISTRFVLPGLFDPA